MAGRPRPTVGSLFSGIGGFDLGLERAGWEVVWQVETHPFRRQLLRRHWPEVDLRDDIRTDTDGLARVDLVCGGFPCQDVSVAGRRAGLAGQRSGLFFQFARVLRTLRPAWCLIENVPGLLTTNDGRDFAVVLATLADLGYWWTYRVLDSQHFGVPQRRRRVYVVGRFGTPCPPEVLFESQGLRRDSAEGQAARPYVAGTLGGGAGVRGWNDDPDRSGAFVPETSYALKAQERNNSGTGWSRTYIPERANCLGAEHHGWSTDPDRAGAFIPELADTLGGGHRDKRPYLDGQPAYIPEVGRPVVPGPRLNPTDETVVGTSPDRGDETRQTYVVNARQDPIVGPQPLDTDGHSLAVVGPTAGTVTGAEAHNGNSRPIPDNYVVRRTAHPVRADRRIADSHGDEGNIVVGPEADPDGVRTPPGVPRRLDPETADGPRYAALGDAVTVPVAEWIGRRLLLAHDRLNERSPE